jgi:DnaJ-domain-containing protein 1
MDRQLHEFSDSCETSGQFTNRMQQLMGADFEPDPLFLEETWRLGLPTAAENWHRRRREREDRNRRGAEEQEAIPFFSSTEWIAEFVMPAAAPAEEVQPRTSPSWTPQSWTPLDRSAQRWIPHGWMPQGWAPCDDDPPAHRASTTRLGNDTEADRAYRILSVSPDSTREQIRSAYRRKVSQCHPDRLRGVNDSDRQLATEQMAELNQAYRLLCDLLLQKAA